MPSRARTIDACNRDAARALLEANFTPRPVFRMGFDAHVRTWRRHMQRRVYVAYHTDSAFAAAIDARVAADRALPMPRSCA